MFIIVTSMTYQLILNVLLKILKIKSLHKKVSRNDDLSLKVLGSQSVFGIYAIYGPWQFIVDFCIFRIRFDIYRIRFQ